MPPEKSPDRAVAVASRQLRETEERFRLIVESVRDYAIFMLDSDGTIASWNAGAERIKGYRAEEILGRHFSIFYLPDAVAEGKPARELQLAREHGRVEDEGWRVRKDGTHFWANVVITALFDEGGALRGFAKVTRDLTERRAHEEAERRAALYQEASRLKDDFLAMVSHELRTPINVIMGQVARLKGGHLDAGQQARAWDSLIRNVQAQARIIDDLLDVSRIVTGKLVLHRQPVSIQALLHSTVEEMRAVAERQQLDLEIRLPDEPVSVVADEGRLRQVFGNLLANAIKFTPPGGLIILEGERDGGSVLIRVRDTGAGIDPDFLPHIFDRFSQADPSVRREHGGLGLGLAIARELVVRHGGALTAASPGPGRGATFTVRLPLSA